MGLQELVFITYRMMPFIMVSFLVIQSLFSNDMSGFFILVGLLLSSVVTIVISKTQLVTNSGVIEDDMLRKCNLITLGNQVLSYLPLSTHTFAYILSYFIYVTIYHKIAKNNLFLLSILSIILAIDVVFNYRNCAKNLVVIPLFIGALSGLLWASTIGPDKHMVPKKDDKSSCSVNKNVYNCKIKRSIVS